MRVKCVICDQIDNLDDGSAQAKKLRNRPIHTYMCTSCNERISEKTKERFSDGSYKVYHRIPQREDEW